MLTKATLGWQLLGLVSYEFQEGISQRGDVLERTFILGECLREKRQAELPESRSRSQDWVATEGC